MKFPKYNKYLTVILEQEVRDQALDDLIRLLVEEKTWFRDEDKDIKKIWEGLFYSKYDQLIGERSELFTGGKELANS